MDWRRWAALAALVSLAAFVLGFSNTQRRVDSNYRWHLQVQTAASTNLKVRFPRGSTASNAIPTAANSRSVHNVELIQYDTGTANCDWIVWSRAFPAGLDTIRVNQNLRTKVLAGFQIDSLEYIGVATAPFIGVTAAGAY